MGYCHTGVSCLREDDGEHGGAKLAVDLRHPHLHLLNSNSNSSSFLI